MACVITNDGSSLNGLVRSTGASGLPGYDITVTWQMQFTNVDPSRYSTYVTHGPNTFNLTNNYWVAFKGISPTNVVAIGSDGDDTYHASFVPTVGPWYQMAFRRRSTGGSNREQLFYPNLGNDTSIVVSRPDTDGENLTSDLVFAIGYSPWIGGEGMEGKVRAVKVFTSVLTLTQMVNESAYANVYDPSLASSLWGRWNLNSDGTDQSGNARHLSANGTVSFDNQPAPEFSGGGPLFCKLINNPLIAGRLAL
jgi:hypothetical protein